MHKPKKLLFTILLLPILLLSSNLSFSADPRYQEICQNDAADSGLTGEDEQAFIAQCLENYIGYDEGTDMYEAPADEYESNEPTEELESEYESSDY